MKISAGRVVLTSFLVDISDVLLNVVLAIISGSAVMISQALQGTADLLTSGLLLVGLNRANRRSDREHPFGYGRELYFWTLMSGLAMFLITAVSSVMIGWQRFQYPEPINNFPLAVTVLLIGLVTNSYALWLSFERLRRDQPDQSIVETFVLSNLVETKTTFVLDLMGTLAAVLGLLAYLVYVLTNDLRLDGLGAIFTGIGTGVLAILLMVDIKDLLVGRGASAATEEDIRVVVLGIRGVRAIRELQTMQVGSEKILLHLDIEVDAAHTSQKISELVHRIKTTLRKILPSIRYVQVETETSQPKRRQKSR